MSDSSSDSRSSNFVVFFGRDGSFNKIVRLTPEQEIYSRQNTNFYVFRVKGQLLQNLFGLEKRISKLFDKITTFEKGV